MPFWKKSISTIALIFAFASCHKPESTDIAAKETDPVTEKETLSLSEPVGPGETPVTKTDKSAGAPDFSKTVEPLDVSELPKPIRGTGYQLVFHDEFAGPAGSPASKGLWSDWAPGTRKDAFNVADTCRLDGKGNLAITIRRNLETGRIETGGITSQRKFQATHGYYECRCKVSDVDGAWSAFWIQSPTVGNPLGDAVKAGVEIDVLECFSGHKSYKNTARNTGHWDGYGKDHKHEAIGVKLPGITENFHAYAVKWDEKGYVFFIDGVESGRWKGVPISNRLQYLILSCEVQKWAGDISRAKLPGAFVIDHVRVWQTPAQMEADATRHAPRPKAK